jgi:hypothetical protein
VGVVILVVLLVMVVMSIHWIRVISARYAGGAATTALDTPSDSPSPEDPSSGPASPTTPTDGLTEVGETHQGENADTTLLRVKKVVGSDGREAPAGDEWLGIRAETCLHEDATASGGLSWSTWQAIDDDGNKFLGADVPWDDFPPQQLPTTGIDPGECNVGWVLIAVPRGTTKHLHAVIFRPHAPEPAQWVV